LQGSDGHLYGVGRVPNTPYWQSIFFRFHTGADVPTAASAQALAGIGVRLKWTAEPGVQYAVRRGASTDALSLIAYSVNGSEFIDTGVVRWQRYYYSVSAVNAFGEGAPSPPLAVFFGRAVGGDIDFDGRRDRVVHNNTTGLWTIALSAGATGSVALGAPGDIPLTGDFDGDGQVDITAYRPSTGEWRIRTSSSGFDPSRDGAYLWGAPGDIPLIADFEATSAPTLRSIVRRPANGSRGAGPARLPSSNGERSVINQSWRTLTATAVQS
jgi:hypothetical protein